MRADKAKSRGVSETVVSETAVSRPARHSEVDQLPDALAAAIAAQRL